MRARALYLTRTRYPSLGTAEIVHNFLYKNVRCRSMSERFSLSNFSMLAFGTAVLASTHGVKWQERNQASSCEEPSALKQIVILVRHGESEAQVRCLLGQAGEYPLTTEGVHQARLVGSFHAESLRAAASRGYVATSSLKRAVQTAEVAMEAAGASDAEKSQISVCDGLRELYRGVMDSKCMSDPELLSQWKACWALVTPVRADNRQRFRPCEEAETYEELQERTLGSIEELLAELPGKGTQGPLWIFAHSYVIRALVWRVLGVPADVHPLYLSNCAVTIFERDAEPGASWRIMQINDTSHLHAATAPATA